MTSGWQKDGQEELYLIIIKYYHIVRRKKCGFVGWKVVLYHKSKILSVKILEIIIITIMKSKKNRNADMFTL